MLQYVQFTTYKDNRSQPGDIEDIHNCSALSNKLNNTITPRDISISGNYFVVIQSYNQWEGLLSSLLKLPISVQKFEFLWLRMMEGSRIYNMIELMTALSTQSMTCFDR